MATNNPDEQRSPLRAIAFNCTLKRPEQPSSTAALLGDIRDALAEHGIETEIVTATAYNILPGTKSDEGLGDD